MQICNLLAAEGGGVPGHRGPDGWAPRRHTGLLCAVWGWSATRAVVPPPAKHVVSGSEQPPPTHLQTSGGVVRFGGYGAGRIQLGGDKTSAVEKDNILKAAKAASQLITFPTSLHALSLLLPCQDIAISGVSSIFYKRGQRIFGKAIKKCSD